MLELRGVVYKRGHKEIPVMEGSLMNGERRRVRLPHSTNGLCFLQEPVLNV